MAGSQLKRLKASLKDQGIIGPQRSKKQKRQNAQDAKASTDKRLQRHEALASIREQFNPFQFKTNARGPKFEVTTNKPQNDKLAKGIQGRPGLAKATAEQRVCRSHTDRPTGFDANCAKNSDGKLFWSRCNGATRSAALSIGVSARTIPT